MEFNIYENQQSHNLDKIRKSAFPIEGMILTKYTGDKMKTLRTLWKKRNSETAYINNQHRTVKVDAFMVGFITAINSTYLDTLACCSGHGKYPMTIIVKDKLGIYDFLSGKAIPRKRRFYFKDEKGFYYIPETIGIKKNKCGDRVPSVAIDIS